MVLVNFNDYQVVRINEAPGGMGKPGTSATMPAIANATLRVLIDGIDLNVAHVTSVRHQIGSVL